MARVAHSTALAPFRGLRGCQRVAPSRHDLPRAFGHRIGGRTLAFRRHSTARRSGDAVGITEPHTHERVLLVPEIFHGI